MKWIKTSDKLPEEGKYVLARHSRGTWMDSTDQKNVNCIVVKLVKGISRKERFFLTDDDPKKRRFSREDQHGNNAVPYCWEMFGPDYFFGQDIIEWTPIK